MERPGKLSRGSRKVKTNNYFVYRYTFNVYIFLKKRYNSGYTREWMNVFSLCLEKVSQVGPLYTTYLTIKKFLESNVLSYLLRKDVKMKFIYNG